MDQSNNTINSLNDELSNCKNTIDIFVTKLRDKNNIEANTKNENNLPENNEYTEEVPIQ